MEKPKKDEKKKKKRKRKRELFFLKFLNFKKRITIFLVGLIFYEGLKICVPFLILIFFSFFSYKKREVKPTIRRSFHHFSLSYDDPNYNHLKLNSIQFTSSFLFIKY